MHILFLALLACSGTATDTAAAPTWHTVERACVDGYVTGTFPLDVEVLSVSCCFDEGEQAERSTCVSAEWGTTAVDGEDHQLVSVVCDCNAEEARVVYVEL